MVTKTSNQRIGKNVEKLRIYLAGPEVFLSNADAIGKRKKELCSKYGFEGIFPIDAEVARIKHKKKMGYSISAANEELIKGCQLLIANITPFRGISSDVGTAYEMGYARGIGLIIFAYTNVPTPFLERTISAFSKKIRRDINGNYRDSNDMLIENWGFSDNLMLEGSIYNSGGVLIKEYVTEEEQFEYLGGFEKCLRHARAELQISRYCRSNNKIKIKKQISY